MHQVQILCVVALSGALGALARYASVQGATYLWGDRFPYGTLLVNVAGCLVIGIAAAALTEPHKQTAQTLWLRYGLMVGFLGAYTTFSAFSLDTLKHFQQGETHWALLNILANVTLCLAAVWAGWRLGEAIF
jgi:fluoride exporter